MDDEAMRVIQGLSAMVGIILALTGVVIIGYTTYTLGSEYFQLALGIACIWFGRGFVRVASK